MKKIIVITGGQRSGKSRYAQNIAIKLSNNPIYLATSRVWDDEHKERINHHKLDRGNEWITIEEEKYLSNHNLNNKVVLVDCVTLWATNFFFDLEANTENALNALKNEFDKLIKQNAIFIFVSNEIGMGEMSTNNIQRRFADLQGWINQYIAHNADEVFFMISGIPMKIK